MADVLLEVGLVILLAALSWAVIVVAVLSVHKMRARIAELENVITDLRAALRANDYESF